MTLARVVEEQRPPLLEEIEELRLRSIQIQDINIFYIKHGIDREFSINVLHLGIKDLFLEELVYIVKVAKERKIEDGLICWAKREIKRIKARIYRAKKKGKGQGFQLVDQAVALWSINETIGIRIVNPRTHRYNVIDRARQLSLNEIQAQEDSRISDDLSIAMGQALAAPIRRGIDYQGLARNMITVDSLPTRAAFLFDEETE